ALERKPPSRQAQFGFAVPRAYEHGGLRRVHDDAAAMAADLGAVMRDARASVGRGVLQLAQHLGKARLRRRPQATRAQEEAQQVARPRRRERPEPVAIEALA